MTKEEAINILRETHDNSLFSVRTALETLIPELKESEDERIRQGLIRLMTVAGEAYLVSSTGIKKETYLAYLERQRECVSEDFESIWKTEDCKTLLDEGEKLSPRFKEMFKEVCHSWYDKGIEVGVKQKEQKPNFDTHWENGSMVCEQKEEKIEWSDEDIEKNLIAYLRYERKSTPQEIEEKFIPYIKRIREMYQHAIKSLDRYNSLKEKIDKIAAADALEELKLVAGVRAEKEPKQEWSEEDEKMRVNILNALTPQLVYSVGKGTCTGTSTYKYDDEIKWLKSLRPVSKESLQPHWKPSEEQMEALRVTIDFMPDTFKPRCTLITLQNGLEKLMSL